MPKEKPDSLGEFLTGQPSKGAFKLSHEDVEAIRGAVSKPDVVRVEPEKVPFWKRVMLFIGKHLIEIIVSVVAALIAAYLSGVLPIDQDTGKHMDISASQSSIQETQPSNPPGSQPDNSFDHDSSELLL